MILLTGFEPFAGDRHNPSAAVVEALREAVFAEVPVRGLILPVDSRAAPERLEAALRPEVRAVVMLGLARGRSQVALERVAVNWAEDRIPDNAGRVRRGEALYPGAPDAHLSSLPLEAILEAWRAAGLPGYVSDSAGLFLCNQVFYAARHLRPDVPAGFIHLPSDETLALGRSEPFVPLEWQRRNIAVALETVAQKLVPLIPA